MNRLSNVNNVGILYLIIFVLCISFSSVVKADTIDYIVKGDVDGNLVVDAEDALEILKVSAKLKNMDNSFSIRSNDFDGNYLIDAADALEILKVSARLLNGVLLSDSKGFYKNIKYSDGYPVSDFFSERLSDGYKYSLEQGIMEADTLMAYLDKYAGGVKETGPTIKADTEGFYKLYWESRWLIEDALANNEYEKLDLKQIDFIDNNIVRIKANCYELRTLGFAECMINSRAKLFLYITDNNELYFCCHKRFDLFLAEESSLIFKYTGTIPESLKYDNLNRLYDKY